MRIPLIEHTRDAAHIDVDYQDGAVVLTLDPLAGETFDDKPIVRILDPSDARDLAQMMTTAADIAQRQR